MMRKKIVLCLLSTLISYYATGRELVILDSVKTKITDPRQTLMILNNLETIISDCGIGSSNPPPSHCRVDNPITVNGSYRIEINYACLLTNKELYKDPRKGFIYEEKKLDIQPGETRVLFCN